MKRDLQWRANRLATATLVAATVLMLSACVSVGVGNEAAPQRMFVLHDPGATGATAAPAKALAKPLVAALLIQPMPSGAVADTMAIAYSRRANELAFYQLATWHERPVRQIPRLLQQRLEARGLAGAVGLVGDPLSGDWLLTLRIDRFEHDFSASPGTARVVLHAELFNRRKPGRVARQQFESGAALSSADSAAAAQALSVALGQGFDALVPWLQEQLAAPMMVATPQPLQ